MSSDAATSFVAFASRKPRIEEESCSSRISDTEHTEEEQMAGPRRQDLGDELDSHLGPLAEMFIRSQERSDERFARLIEVTAGSGKKQWGTVLAVIASCIAGLALLANVGGIQYRNAGESDLKEKIAVLTEKLEQSERRQSDQQKSYERQTLLLDERYRQISIALEARGVKLPNQ